MWKVKKIYQFSKIRQHIQTSKPILYLTFLITNYVSVALASPRTPAEKQATLLASRRERHYELRIGINIFFLSI